MAFSTVEKDFWLISGNYKVVNFTEGNSTIDDELVSILQISS
jgi:hypothetical protein